MGATALRRGPDLSTMAEIAAHERGDFLLYYARSPEGIGAQEAQ